MKYSQEELNQILLSKPLNEFYFAILENREKPLTNEEFEKIISRDDNVYNGVSKEEVDDISNLLQEDEMLKNYSKDIMKIFYSFARIRELAIITMIDDDVYNIGNIEFVDLKSKKIINYDNFENYYNDKNARIRFFTPEEEPSIKQNTVLVDVDDESFIYAYEKAHINQKESEDLTSSFLTEVKGKTNTLKKINRNK